VNIIDRIKEIFPEYNYDLTIYKNIRTDITLICKKHGIFDKKPSLMLYSKQGCPKCGLVKRNESKINNFKELVSRFNLVHNNLYDYSSSEYIRNNIKIKIKCQKHGYFYQRPDNHLSGSGCIICGKNKMVNSKKYNTDIFVNLSNKKHNNLYKYNETVYEDSQKEVIITCESHGNFEQRPVYHLGGSGCPKCYSSKGEKNIRDILISNNIDFVEQHSFNNCIFIKPLKFDFYIPKYNIVIEYDGRHHFESIECWGGETELEKIKLKDNIKNQYCEDNSIDILRISYLENYDKVMVFFEERGY
jgi:very-short-patch-repair endonuclease